VFDFDNPNLLLNLSRYQERLVFVNLSRC